MKIFAICLMGFAALNGAGLAALAWASILGYKFNTGDGGIFVAVTALGILAACIGAPAYYSERERQERRKRCLN